MFVYSYNDLSTHRDCRHYNSIRKIRCQDFKPEEYKVEQ